jgi:hypothetical protein
MTSSVPLPPWRAADTLHLGLHYSMAVGDYPYLGREKRHDPNRGR